MSSKRGLIVALIVSLCINLALVGFLLGRASSFEFRRETINPMWGPVEPGDIVGTAAARALGRRPTCVSNCG